MGVVTANLARNEHIRHLDSIDGKLAGPLRLKRRTALG